MPRENTCMGSHNSRDTPESVEARRTSIRDAEGRFQSTRAHVPEPLDGKPCSDCRRLAKPLRNGRCHACDQRERRRVRREREGRLRDAVPQLQRTHCPRGHPYDEENTRISPKGHRQCRACGREHQRRIHRQGVSDKRYGLQLEAQRGVCAICGRPPEETHSTSNAREPQLAVDHAHISGELRGLLCPPCNRGLGSFGDDAARLRAAAAYIDRPVWNV